MKKLLNNNNTKVSILWGETPQIGDVASTYTFATQGELNAFLLGINETEGWMGYAVVEEGYVHGSDPVTDEPEYEWHIIRWPTRDGHPCGESDTWPWTGGTTKEHVFEVFKQTMTPDDPQADFEITDEKTFDDEDEAWEYLRSCDPERIHHVQQG